MTMPPPTVPEEIPPVRIEQTDTRRIQIPYPGDPEKLSEALHEAAVAGFQIVDATQLNEIVGPNGGLRLTLTRQVKP